MACFDDDVVADLECRYSDGETPTWEEFYKWIEDIQDGFTSQDHSGAGAGYGQPLGISVVSGLQSALDALDSRITVIETTYATKAYADQAEADAKAYADGLVVDMATQTWVNNTFRTQAACNAYMTTHAGYIDAVEADVVLLDGRVTTIETDYATKLWASNEFRTQAACNSYMTTHAGYIDALEADVADHESRIDYIEIWYATQDFCTTNFRSKFECNGFRSGLESDISDLDGRVWDIESDYTTEWEAYIQGEAAFYDCIGDEIWAHEQDCSCYNTC